MQVKSKCKNKNKKKKYSVCTVCSVQCAVCMHGLRFGVIVTVFRELIINKAWSQSNLTIYTL